MGNNFTILKRKSDFDFVKKNGKRIYPCDWIILSYAPNQLNKTRCGWVISRKVGNAVVRNKLRRWLREIFKSLAHENSKSVDLNVIIREKNEEFFKKQKYSEFSDHIKKAWSKIR